MDTQQDRKLEYIRDSINHFRERARALYDRSTSAKQWVITLWLGTLAVLMTNEMPRSAALRLIVMEVLMFYFLDTYFKYFSIKYERHALFLDGWLMKATEADIAAISTPRDLVEPKPTNSERALHLVESAMSPASAAFYVAMALMSCVACYQSPKLTESNSLVKSILTNQPSQSVTTNTAGVVKASTNGVSHNSHEPTSSTGTQVSAQPSGGAYASPAAGSPSAHP